MTATHKEKTGRVGGLICRECGKYIPGPILSHSEVRIERVGESTAFRFVHVGCKGDRSCQVRACSTCAGVVHPATGFLFGSPREYRACGPCSRAMFAFLKNAMSRRVRGYPFCEFVASPGPDIKPPPRKRPGRFERAGILKKSFLDYGVRFK